jgi:hypothetical protein
MALGPGKCWIPSPSQEEAPCREVAAEGPTVFPNSSPCEGLHLCGCSCGLLALLHTVSSVGAAGNTGWTPGPWEVEGAGTGGCVGDFGVS